jgi:hypothetical protein
MTFRSSFISVWSLLLFTFSLGCQVESAPESLSSLSEDAERAEADPSWLEGAQRHIEEREYWASDSREGLQAPNRNKNFRTYFEASGIRVHDRTAIGSPELLELSVVGLGRGDALAPVMSGVVTSEGARVEIRRPGLVEWYTNSPERSR